MTSEPDLGDQGKQDLRSNCQELLDYWQGRSLLHADL